MNCPQLENLEKKGPQKEVTEVMLILSFDVVVAVDGEGRLLEYVRPEPSLLLLID